MSKPKKLIEVTMPVKEISEESVRDFLKTGKYENWFKDLTVIL